MPYNVKMSYCCKNALNMLRKCPNFTMHIVIIIITIIIIIIIIIVIIISSSSSSSTSTSTSTSTSSTFIHIQEKAFTESLLNWKTSTGPNSAQLPFFMSFHTMP